MPYLLLCALLLSWALTGTVRRYAVSTQLLDHPNSRSSHRVPTPRGGGIAIVASLLLLTLGLGWAGSIEMPLCIALVGAGALVATLGFIDSEPGTWNMSPVALGRALAEAAGVPAYIIFPDRTLIEMAEKQPATLDQMMGITGVGAKKLESFGAAFLSVITGAAAQPMHPARRRLVGQTAGQVYDRLAEVQLGLSRGPDGTGKYLSCTNSTLRQIAEARPSTLSDLDRVQGMGAQKIERFGAAFLDVVRKG